MWKKKTNEVPPEVEEPKTIIDVKPAGEASAQNFKNALLAAAEESLSGPSNISYFEVTVSFI